MFGADREMALSDVCLRACLGNYLGLHLTLVCLVTREDRGRCDPLVLSDRRVFSLSGRSAGDVVVWSPVVARRDGLTRYRRADILTCYADPARIAALTCEGRYDALSAKGAP